MKLKNATTWDDHFLRAMVAWICEEIDCPKRKLKLARFGNRTRGGCNGYAWFYDGEILVRIQKHERTEPQIHTRFGRVHEWADRVEQLVTITAHEICHIRQYNDGDRNGRERECDRVMAEALDAFRAQREALLTAWNAAKRPSKARPKLSAPERREAVARKKLVEWEQKRKRAATAIKKYRTKVQYYDRKRLAAAKTSKGDA